MGDTISQVFIFVLSCLSIWFVGRREKWMRWGYIFGFLSEPFWIYTTWEHQQYGILILSFFYCYAWGQGIYNYWIRG